MQSTREEQQACQELAQALLNLLLANERGQDTRAAMRGNAALTQDDVTEPGTGRLLLTVRDAAKMLSVSERTLQSLTQPHGSIPAVRIGRSVRYSPDDLRAWIALQKAQ